MIYGKDPWVNSKRTKMASRQQRSSTHRFYALSLLPLQKIPISVGSTTEIASASARTILLSIVILLALKPELLMRTRYIDAGEQLLVVN